MKHVLKFKDPVLDAIIKEYLRQKRSGINCL